MVNKVILIGRAGRDPETRYTSTGQTVTNLSVATDESYKDKNGERQQKTEWHRVVAWGATAEIIQKYIRKGALIFIEGKLQTREWEDKRDGTKKSSTEIVAFSMKMLEGKKGESSPPERESEASAEIDDSDIPF